MAKIAQPVPAPNTGPWIGHALRMVKNTLPKNGADAMELLQRLGREIEQDDAGARDRMYVRLGHAFQIARFLKADADAWEEVCASPFWDRFPRQRPHRADTSTALQTALKVVFGPANKHAVSRYKTALQGAFDSGVNPSEVPGLLAERGGIKALSEARKRSAVISEIGRGGIVLVVLPGKTAKRLEGTSAGARVTLAVRVHSVDDGVLYLKGLKNGVRNPTAGRKAKPRKK